MIEFIGPLYDFDATVHKSLSDTVIFFRLDTPLELFRLPTELN
jgi:hypothetical protein